MEDIPVNSRSLPRWIGSYALFLLPVAAVAGGAVSSSVVSFSASTLVDPDANVRGELRLPSGTGKVPAVVVIHNAGGLQDRTGTDYVNALNEAGIATLELDLFPRGSAPASTRGHVPHAYGSLIYLAGNSRIDPSRIGIMGFSYGAILSMVTVSKELTDAYTGGKYQFAAHLPLYLPCWTGNAVMEGRIKSYSQSLWTTATGAPAHILAGEKDDYGEPDMCIKFVGALPAPTRSHVSVTVYPNAFHGWDTYEDRTYYDKFAFSGKGGTVRHMRNVEIAEKSRTFAVEFFRTAFAMK